MGEATTAPRKIADRYRVGRPIGHGGMGTVWLCRDERLERDVAVKQIGTLPGETAPDLARAMREARSSAALNHPHVVSIYDVVEEDDAHIWLVMEYVASRTLAQVIAEDGPLPPEVAVGIGAQIAAALATTHAAGTIHRDVKPGNILVTSENVAKISDFGIARAHDHGQLTRSGLVIGTPTYFSPELARGETPTAACDVWALGASLFAAVEGQPPYEDQPNALALLATIASTPPPAPHNAGFLTEPIERMLDPDPGSRWSMQDAAHVLERLRERHARKAQGPATSELTIPAEAVPEAPVAATSAALRTGEDDVEPARDEDRRRRPGAFLIAGLVGLLALAAVVGFLLLQDNSADPSVASDPKAHPPGTHHSSRATPPTSQPTRSPSSSPAQSQPPPSTTTQPTTTTTTTTQPPSTSGAVVGASAERFVQNYYDALPGDTRTGWSALSPGFQAEIGGYGDYQGVWSTISAVSVGTIQRAGGGAVDVSLTYTRNDGGQDSEVRRIFVERQGSGYLIRDDAVVG